jgi:thioredoxin-like negative regulator of GroEL
VETRVGPSAAEDRVRAAGPIEFEAEECLARGDGARALVLASGALRERPESLTLRALVERARKAVLRGRRGEKLEQRIREAHDLFELGDFSRAERIVASALKLVPNHAAALALFARIRDRRLAAPSAEAEAEHELDRMARAQARQAQARARALSAAGNERGAFVAVWRGLQRVPDDPDLLALFANLQGQLERLAAVHASRGFRRPTSG